jgi:hypothetical protein
VDWEVELAAVIGRECKRIRRAEAMDYIAWFSVMNDVSGREAQFGDPQWFRGKSFDTFAPLGPALVTPDEAGDIGDLALEAVVNGMVMQSDRTRHLIFDVAAISSSSARTSLCCPATSSPPARRRGRHFPQAAGDLQPGRRGRVPDRDDRRDRNAVVRIPWCRGRVTRGELLKTSYESEL